MTPLLLISLLAIVPKSQSPTSQSPAAAMAHATDTAQATAPTAPHNAGNKAFAVPGPKPAYANKAQAQDLKTDVNMARLGLVLLIIGALGLGFWFFKKRQMPFASSALIHKIAHSQIVPGQGVSLVEVDGRMLVLGTGQGGLRLLYHYPVDNSEALAEPDFSDSVHCDEASDLRQRLKNIGQREFEQSEMNLSRSAQNFSVDKGLSVS